MWKSFLHKEWLKLRWVYIAVFSIWIFLCVLMVLQLKHRITFRGSSTTWYNILQFKYLFFESFRLVPLASGIALSIFQFLPEIIHKRLKLSFHLPISAASSISIMLFIGLTFLSCLAAITICTVYLFIGHFLPVMISNAGLQTMASWFLGGTMAYLIGVSILLEPLWKQRLFMVFLGIVSLLFPFQESVMKGMSPVLPLFFAANILWMLTVYYSAKRFEKVNP